MSRSMPVLRLIFGAFGGEPSPDKKSLQSFIKLAPKSSLPYVNTQRHDPEDTLVDRWKRAEDFIDLLVETFPPAKVQILTYSMGCHLGVNAASLIQKTGKHHVDGIFLVVPDPKYRVVKEDELDKLRKRKTSAYEEACAFWNVPSPPGNDSPGEHLQKALLLLATHKQPVEIHLVASRFDTVAEWRNNTERLYKATESQPRVYWHFPPGEPRDRPRKAPNYAVQAKLNPLNCEDLGEIWIHASLDCTIKGGTSKKKKKQQQQQQQQQQQPPKKR